MSIILSMHGSSSSFQAIWSKLWCISAIFSHSRGCRLEKGLLYNFYQENIVAVLITQILSRSLIITLGKYKASCNFQCVRFLRPNIWALVPQNIKKCKSLQEFKRLIKVWKPEACPCRMCEKYVANIAFIWLNINLS